MPALQKKKPSLAELQDWLRWAITEPRGIARVLDETAGPCALVRRPEPARLLRWIQDAPPIPVATRLSVYSDAYFTRLLESLGSDFKVLRRVLGERDFRALAADYFAAHPSTSPNIADAGSSLPEFLKSHALTDGSPYLPELAALERAVLRALFSDRLPPFDPAAVRDFSPEDWSRATLAADPTVQLLDTDWPVDRLWKREGLRRLAKPRARHLLIFRDENWAQVRVLKPRERSTLVLIQEGKTLGDIVGARAGADLPALFADWTSAGILKQVLR